MAVFRGKTHPEQLRREEEEGLQTAVNLRRLRRNQNKATTYPPTGKKEIKTIQLRENSQIKYKINIINI